MTYTKKQKLLALLFFLAGCITPAQNSMSFLRAAKAYISKPAVYINLLGIAGISVGIIGALQDNRKSSTRNICNSVKLPTNRNLLEAFPVKEEYWRYIISSNFKRSFPLLSLSASDEQRDKFRAYLKREYGWKQTTARL